MGPLPRLVLVSSFLFLAAGSASGQPRQEVFKLRPVPPPGKAPSPEQRSALIDGLARLDAAVEFLRARPAAARWLADVEIFARAVRVALRDDGFHPSGDVATAEKLLAEGMARAKELGAGRTPWMDRPGPTALGYVSALDGTVQPYGLYLPPSFPGQGGRRWRLDAWFHGRDETLTELKFIAGAFKGGGPFERPDALTLQPYGRYCLAAKFAGEVDFFEALADVKSRFRIDEDRVVVRGFSMGGASTWHLAAHHAAAWAAAAPGAGFAESRRYLEGNFGDKLRVPWWEETLWQLYDAPAYAENFRNLPIIAYSGERDKQKQAADLMAEVLAGVGVQLTHVIGPGTAHAYHPESKQILNQLVDALAAGGRDPLPRRVSLATPTLRYNRQAWVTVDGLGRHWEKATIEAERKPGAKTGGPVVIEVRTRNVTAFTLDVPTGHWTFASAPPRVIIDGQRFSGPLPLSDRSWRAPFHRSGTRWLPGPAPREGLRKRHGLQGPIDDAFMGPFLFVTPTAKARHAAIAEWAHAEQARATREWQRLFRGEVRSKKDVEVTPEDMAVYNLVLWGDPASNTVMGRVAEALPIEWRAEGITVRGTSHGADRHALLAVYPNPMAEGRYVVLNSGVTFREFHYLTNARQTPKLPDWAVVDVTTPPDAQAPGKVVDAGFFDEGWALPPGRAGGPRPHFTQRSNSPAPKAR